MSKQTKKTFKRAFFSILKLTNKVTLLRLDPCPDAATRINVNLCGSRSRSAILFPSVLVHIYSKSFGLEFGLVYIPVVYEHFTI